MKKLEWGHLKKLGKSDNAGRWYPINNIAVEYCKEYRSPSRAFPLSYARACLTQKFFRFLQINHSDLLTQIIAS